MNAVETWHYEALGKSACAALGKNGFDARYAASGEEALRLVTSFIKPGMGGALEARRADIHANYESPLLGDQAHAGDETEFGHAQVGLRFRDPFQY